MKTSVTILLLLATLAFAQYHDQPECNQGLPALTPGLTTDFQNWLNANGYSSYGFERTDLAGGAYGGRSSSNQTLNNDPIIFYHGNSDIAVGNGTAQYSWQTGFRDLIDYLLTKGYTSAELYITTWGPGNANDAYNQNHNADYVTYLRAFTEAVLNYTGATTFNVVAHSMGVTFARKVIKGGVTVDTGVNIGPSLAPMVSSFIGLAGANYGLQTCQYLTNYPTCAQELGFYPGTGAGSNGIPTNFGTYLADLAENGGKEGEWVATLWSTPFDSVIGIESIYGHNTSDIPTQDASKQYPGVSWTHFDLRDGTCEEVLTAIQTHSLP